MNGTKQEPAPADVLTTLGKSVPGGTFLLVLILGWQNFSGFGDVKGEVQRISIDLQSLVGQIDDVKENLSSTRRSVDALVPTIAEIRTNHDKEIAELEADIEDNKRQIEFLQDCVRMPDRCTLRSP